MGYMAYKDTTLYDREDFFGYIHSLVLDGKDMEMIGRSAIDLLSSENRLDERIFKMVNKYLTEVFVNVNTNKARQFVKKYNIGFGTLSEIYRALLWAEEEWNEGKNKNPYRDFGMTIEPGDEYFVPEGIAKIKEEMRKLGVVFVGDLDDIDLGDKDWKDVLNEAFSPDDSPEK